MKHPTKDSSVGVKTSTNTPLSGQTDQTFPLESESALVFFVALTAPCSRTATTLAAGRRRGRISEEAARWKCRWCPGWGRCWRPALRWSRGRTASLRGTGATSSVRSCPRSRPASGSGSPSRRWRGTAGGCGLVEDRTMEKCFQKLTSRIFISGWQRA